MSDNGEAIPTIQLLETDYGVISLKWLRRVAELLGESLQDFQKVCEGDDGVSYTMPASKPVGATKSFLEHMYHIGLDVREVSMKWLEKQEKS